MKDLQAGYRGWHSRCTEPPNYCVEVAGNLLDSSVAVRDSENPAGRQIVLDGTSWITFTDTIKLGGHGFTALSGVSWTKVSGTMIELCVADDLVLVRDAGAKKNVLAFDEKEWSDFTAGVTDGEFDHDEVMKRARAA